MSKKFTFLSLTKTLNSDHNQKLLIQIGLLCIASIIIWFMSTHIYLGNTTPIIPAEKRIYLIIALFSVWLLKILWFDFKPKVIRKKTINSKTEVLQNQFLGAIEFLTKTIVVKNNQDIHLSELPWYLMIGPTEAGKTALLANADANFILKKQLQRKNHVHFDSTEHCDWWVTKDTTFVDVPGYYLSTEQYQNLWQCLLTLIQQKRGKLGLNGLIIAIPLPEIIQKSDHKSYHSMLHNLIQGIYILQKTFKYALPCTLIITKCDLLPGFKEFFAELSLEEMQQNWGIQLSSQTNDLENSLIQRFDLLIKKLNEQLITRLHQERNPLLRPYIKDFPLQMERIKNGIVDIIKRCAKARLNFAWQGVYLTSALQDYQKAGATVDQPIIHAPGTLQVFQGPPQTTRAYFIQQLLTQGLPEQKPAMQTHAQGKYPPQWQKHIIYATSLSLIAFSAYVLGLDFVEGMQNTHAIQKYIVAYEDHIQKASHLSDKLTETVILLDNLHGALQTNRFEFDLIHLKTYYKTQSQEKAQLLYQHVLQHIFLADIKDYLADYLKVPVNREAENIYAALKAYLMLNNVDYMQPPVFSATLKHILPHTNPVLQNNLFDHLNGLLMSHWKPLKLDDRITQQTRKYLSNLPHLQLSYAILANQNDHTGFKKLNFGAPGEATDIFAKDELQPFAGSLPANAGIRVLTMYTEHEFKHIITEQIKHAADEAILGNWVIGTSFNINVNPNAGTALIDQLRVAYVTNYIETWENLLQRLHLINPNSLNELDKLVNKLSSVNSPLLQVLKTVHDNTYFEPIISSSSKLKSLGLFYLTAEKNNDDAFPQVLAVLRGLHRYIQPVLTAENNRKASFEIISHRMLHQETPDALLQLRLVADKSPEPIKSWLNKIADNTLAFLMADASHYMDTSWQEKVIAPYTNEIANRYPFSHVDNKNEVKLAAFTDFFGNPGVFMNYYKTYLQNFIDTSKTNWHWKSQDKIKMPLSQKSLQQIQNTYAIHNAFFPKDDNHLTIQLTLQPYQFHKRIRRVSLNLDNNQFIDTKGDTLEAHTFVWPGRKNIQKSIVQLTLNNRKVIQHQYTGTWAWLKLINQTFDTLITDKEMLINLSVPSIPAKYVVLTEGDFTPSLAINLRDFQLPHKISAQSVSD